MYNEHHNHSYSSPPSHRTTSPPSLRVQQPTDAQQPPPRGKHRLRARSLLRGAGGPAWQPTRLTSSYCVLRAAGVQEDYYTSCLSWGQQHVALALREHVLLFHPRQPDRGGRPVLPSSATAATSPTAASASSSSPSQQQRHTTAATTSTTTFNDREHGGAGRHPSSVAIARSDDRALFLGFSDGTAELYRSVDGGALASELRFDMPDALATCDSWLSLPPPPPAPTSSSNSSSSLRAVARLAPATAAQRAAAAIGASPPTPTSPRSLSADIRRNEMEAVVAQLRGTIRTMAPTLSSITAMATSAYHPSLVALTSSSEGLLLLDHRQRKPTAVFAYSPSHDNHHNMYTTAAPPGGAGPWAYSSSGSGSGGSGSLSVYPARGAGRWWPPPGATTRRPTTAFNNNSNNNNNHHNSYAAPGGGSNMMAVRTDSGTGTLYDTSPMYASSIGSGGGGGGYSPEYVDAQLHREQEEAEEREVIDWFYYNGDGARRPTAAPTATTTTAEAEAEEGDEQRLRTPPSEAAEDEGGEAKGADGGEGEEEDVRERTYIYEEEEEENDEDAQMVLRYLHQAANYLLSQDRLCSASFNACGELVATGSSSGVVQVWSIHQNRQPLYSFTFRPYLSGGVNSSSVLGRSSSSGSGSGSAFRHPSPTSTTPRSQGSPRYQHSPGVASTTHTETTVKALAFHPTLPYELAVAGGVGPAGVQIYDLSDGGGSPDDHDALAESLPAYTQAHAGHAGGGRAPRCVAAGATQAAALQLLYAPDGGHLVTSHGPLRPAGGPDGDVVAAFPGTLSPLERTPPAATHPNTVAAGAGANTDAAPPGELWQSNALLVWPRSSGGSGAAAAATGGGGPYDSPHAGGQQTLLPLYALPGHRARPLHIAAPYSSSLPTYAAPSAMFPTASDGGGGRGSHSDSGHGEPRPLSFPQEIMGREGSGGDGTAGANHPYMGCVASVAGGEDSTIRFWDIFHRRPANRHAAPQPSPPYPPYASGTHDGYAETELR